MRLEPFVSVDDVDFSATVDELLRSKGPPGRRTRNEVGLNELDYGRTVYRFEDNGRLEEITADAPVVNFGAVAVPFGALSSFVTQHDPQVFERARFLVSPRFGIAFDPADAPWVTALATHCIPLWRAL